VNQQAQAQQPQQNANTPFAGGLTMGQGTQNQQSVPGVRIDISNIRSTTRFNDLHDDLQKQIENIDKVILAQAQQSNDINAIMPSHDEQLSFIPDNTNFLTRKLIGVESSLESDAESVALVRTLVESDAENAKLSFRAVDNLKLPQQYHHQGIWNAKATPPNPTSPEGEGAQDIVSFFSQTADEMNSTLSTYQSRIREIEQHLRGVEAQTMHQAQLLTSGGDDRGQSLRELSAVLRDFEQGILGVAGSVGKAREGVQKLQMGGFGDLGSEKAARVNGNGKRGGIY
jgi:nucleoporin p58/p45